MFTAKLHLKPVRKILADTGRRHKRNVTPLSTRHVVIVGDIKMSEVIKTSEQDVRAIVVNCRSNRNISPVPFITTMQLLKYVKCMISVKVKKKQSHYTPWRRLGGEEVQLILVLDLGTRWG
jgi:hypothetical protein